MIKICQPKYLIIVFLFFQAASLNSQTWRSSLYPDNWSPGYSDSKGRFLHDFSFAGYHGGMEIIPQNSKKIVVVTLTPYNADKTGVVDATVAIQKAIDYVGQNGGGVVFLPAGEYSISILVQTFRH